MGKYKDQKTQEPYKPREILSQKIFPVLFALILLFNII